jgi:type II secretory pathway component GspD/PulD (secretin)
MLRRNNSKYLKSLEDILSVQMHIPRPVEHGQGGKKKGPSSNSSGDILIIRGSQDRVDSAVGLIEEIAQHSADVSVPVEVISVILGPNGETINAIQEDFGVNIDLVRNTGTKLTSPTIGSGSSKNGPTRSTGPATATIHATSMPQLEGALTRVNALVSNNKHEHVEIDLQPYNAGAGVVIGKGKTISVICIYTSVSENSRY